MSSIPGQNPAQPAVQYDRDEEEYEGPRQILPNAEDIPDGIYHGQIILAMETTTLKKADRIIRYQMRIINGPAPAGFVFEFVRGIETVEDLRWAGGSLKPLDFDTQNWLVANGRPFRSELRKAMPKLQGMYVCFVKKTNDKNYANIDFSSRLPGPPPRDPAMSVARQTHAPAPRAPAQAPADAPNGPAPSRWPAAKKQSPGTLLSDDEIPF